MCLLTIAVEILKAQPVLIWREHGHIENKLQYIRNVMHGEDTCRWSCVEQ